MIWRRSAPLPRRRSAAGQMGLEVDIPIGFRQANASVRYAELNLAREKAVLEEQQNAITHDLSSAYGEMARA